MEKISSLGSGAANSRIGARTRTPPNWIRWGKISRTKSTLDNSSKNYMNRKNRKWGGNDSNKRRRKLKEPFTNKSKRHNKLKRRSWSYKERKRKRPNRENSKSSKNKRMHYWERKRNWSSSRKRLRGRSLTISDNWRSYRESGNPRKWTIPDWRTRRSLRFWLNTKSHNSSNRKVSRKISLKLSLSRKNWFLSRLSKCNKYCRKTKSSVLNLSRNIIYKKKKLMKSWSSTLLWIDELGSEYNLLIMNVYQ